MWSPKMSLHQQLDSPIFHVSFSSKFKELFQGVNWGEWFCFSGANSYILFLFPWQVCRRVLVWRFLSVCHLKEKKDHYCFKFSETEMQTLQTFRVEKWRPYCRPDWVQEAAVTVTRMPPHQNSLLYKNQNLRAWRGPWQGRWPPFHVHVASSFSVLHIFPCDSKC